LLAHLPPSTRRHPSVGHADGVHNYHELHHVVHDQFDDVLEDQASPIPTDQDLVHGREQVFGVHGQCADAVEECSIREETAKAVVEPVKQATAMSADMTGSTTDDSRSMPSPPPQGEYTLEEAGDQSQAKPVSSPAGVRSQGPRTSQAVSKGHKKPLSVIGEKPKSPSSVVQPQAEINDHVLDSDIQPL